MREIAGYNGSYVLDGDRLRFEFYPDEKRKAERIAAQRLAVKATAPRRTARLAGVDTGRVVEVCAEVCGVSADDAMGKSRRKRIALARHLSWYMLRTLRRLTYQDIAYLWGRCDHSAVIHGVSKIATGIGIYSEIAKAVDSALSILEGLDKEGGATVL